MKKLRPSPIIIIMVLGALLTTPNKAAGEPSATKLQEGGRYPRYNATVDKIIFDMRVVDFGDVLIYSMNPDGTKVSRLSTPDIGRGGHQGQPFWHPSGDYIIFTAENENYTRTSLAGYVEQPGLGRNGNVWIMRADGSEYWRFTDVVENGSHIRARFSPDGTKVFWNQDICMELDPAGCSWKDNEPTHPGWEYCNFRIVWGNIDLSGGEPQVSDLHEIEFFDEDGWRQDPTGDNGLFILESQGFSPDGTKIIFTACNPHEVFLETGEYSCLYGGDYYTTNLDGTELIRLTHSIPGHKENAEYSPDGTRILYTRTTEQVGKSPEWYIMKSDGSDFPGFQVTTFGDPENPFYHEHVFGGEADWMDNDTVLLNVPYWTNEQEKIFLHSDLLRIDRVSCGSGDLDGSELCDGDNLGGETCQSLGYSDGDLTCNSACEYDLSGCIDTEENNGGCNCQIRNKKSTGYGIGHLLAIIIPLLVLRRKPTGSRGSDPVT